MNALRGTTKEISVFGQLVEDIKAMAPSFQWLSFSHIKREGNVVAHKLAKLSCNYNELMIWKEEVPPSIQKFVIDDSVSS